MQLDHKATEKLVASMRLPPAPFVVEELHRLLQNDETTIAEVGDVVAQDMAISSLVLHTVNSSLYGLRRKANSIHQAAALLGMSNTANLVAGLSLRQSLGDNDAPGMQGFWDSPGNIALAAAGIARQLCPGVADEAHLLGLFHNAGHLLMAQRFDGYGRFLRDNLDCPQAPVVELENRHYSCNHAVLGYYLASTWGIQRHLAQIIRDHHDIAHLLEDGDAATAQLAATLKLAEHCDKLFRGAQIDHEWARCGAAVLDFLGCSEPDYEELCADIVEQLAAS